MDWFVHVTRRSLRRRSNESIYRGIAQLIGHVLDLFIDALIDSPMGTLVD